MPPTVLAVSEIVLPSQTGVLLPAVGEAGEGLMVTETVPAVPVHPFSVAVTEYIPVLAVVAGEITRFCVVEEKAFGPLHE